jgi:hypothetical protein
MTGVRSAASDLHKIHREPGKVEPCDDNKVESWVRRTIDLRAIEALILGDGVDERRDRDACEEGGFALGRLVGAPFARHRIPTTYVSGNHDPFRRIDKGRLLRAMIAGGFAPDLITLASGPFIRRGIFALTHGHPFDPSCAGGNLLTTIGEAFTRVDQVLDQIHIDIEVLNPAAYVPAPGEDPILDRPMHRAAMRWAARYGVHLICGHSHVAHEVSGAWNGRAWSVWNTGALTKETPGTFVWFTDEGAGGVEAL